MKDEIQIKSVLEHWELRNPCIEEQLHKDSPRPVYKIITDTGRFILKGFPEKTPETTVQSNMKAHLFLGNEKFLYGNIYENSFEEIWTGTKRQESLNYVRNELNIHECRINCRMDKINSYLWELQNPSKHVNFI